MTTDLREEVYVFTYLREALTARFIAKGIPEPLFVKRVVIQILTLFVYNDNALLRIYGHTDLMPP